MFACFLTGLSRVWANYASGTLPDSSASSGAISMRFIISILLVRVSSFHSDVGQDARLAVTREQAANSEVPELRKGLRVRLATAPEPGS